MDTATACPAVAVVGTSYYPCRSHEGGIPAHHFAAHWPPCEAPFCLLPPGHGSLHDIPSGRAVIVVGLVTLQFASGGLFDAEPVDGRAVHLVMAAKTGTPGPTLCGIDRFHKDSAGWSVGGGISGPGIEHKPCQGCADAAREHFPGLEITGLGAKEMAEALGAPWSHWNGGKFKNA